MSAFKAENLPLPTNLPPAFLERMQRLLGDEFQAFLESFKHPPSAGLRVNTLKISPKAFQILSPYPLSPILWCPSGFFIENGAQSTPGKHPYHAAGLYYLQDPSAMAVVELLNPQPGELVLDLAAAPGGKTTHLASRMNGEGVLLANETHPQRAWELAQNLERWGTQNTAILNETPESLARAFGDVFDKVLLDAPCSGEGMFRKSELARQEWSLKRVASCALRQSAILRQAARLLRPDGLLAYSTCTFAPEENESVVAGFLKEHPHFELLQTQTFPGSSPGRPDWVDTGGASTRQAVAHERLSYATRLWPHHVRGEGHFVAILRRTASSTDVKRGRAGSPAAPAEAARRLREFCSEHLLVEWESKRLTQVGSYLYAVPPGMPGLDGLKVIHPGLWLGTLKTGRFVPAHSLALSLESNQARRVATLNLNEAIGYLSGDTLIRSGPDGWVLMTLDGFPLGWGRRVRGVIKNLYPKGLRWL